MFLPATKVTLPSADFSMRKFKPVYSRSEETLCFTAELVHVPTGGVIYLDNEGHGGDTFANFDTTKDNWREVSKAWREFVESCRPVLAEGVKGTDFEGIYDRGDGLDDSVIGLFTTEADRQKEYNAKRGLVIRTPDMEEGEYGIYPQGVTPEHLKAQNFQGEYWDKKKKSWIAI